jgi:hypothetical protein
MQLTPLQSDCVIKLAEADVRSADTMLGLLLLEGIRFFYCDNEPVNSINNSDSNHNVLKEMADALNKEIQNNLN